MRPVVAPAGKNSDIPVVQVDGDPIAIPLDFIEPVGPDGWTRLEKRQTRLYPNRYRIEREIRL